MKIVIDIPDEQVQCKCEFHFKILCNNGKVDLSSKAYLKQRYGIKFKALPKIHGDLVDKNTIDLDVKNFHSKGDWQTATWAVDRAKVFIPADGE